MSNKRYHIPRLQLYHDLHDSGTQTSKTILELAKIEMTRREISPDSLMSSPPRDDFLSDFEDDEFLDVNEQKHVFKRRQYVGRDEATARGDDVKTTNSKSLIEMFLAKTKTKSGHENRARFLQQISPLRYIPKEDSSMTLKSQSYIEPNRFRVKTVKDCAVEKNDIKPVKYFTNGDCNKTEVATITKRANCNFMCPTISSENKNKLPEVQCLNKLISPPRRGRSYSPEEQRHVVVAAAAPPPPPIVENSNSKHKIPYIDQSEESCVYMNRDKDSGFSDNKKIVGARKTDEIPIANPLLKPSPFDEDLLKIDELSLNLSSEGDLTGSVRVSNSTSSIDNAINSALTKVRDRDWNVALKGLAEIIELCRIFDTDLLFPHMTTVNQRLIELLRSSRSHVCRTACQAAGHLFELVKDTRRPEFDDTVNILLFKTADANKFIRKDANLALDCMVTHITTFHAVRTLCAKGPTHKNDLVRTATARLLVCAVVIAGTENLLNQNGSEHTRKRLITNMVKFLEDKSLETRKYGERLYKVLSREGNFEMYLKRYLEKEEITQMRRSLKLIEKRR